MAVTLTRLFLIYIILLVLMRLMGRRQIGELHSTELVITILLSEIAAAPIVNMDVPMLPSVAAVLTLSALEILLSSLCLYADPLRRALQGKPIPVVRDGQPDQKALRELRVSLEDLLEGLREKDAFDLSEISLAVIEADGKLSVRLNPAAAQVQPADLQLVKKDDGAVLPIICDGKVRKENLPLCGMTDAVLERILRQSGLQRKDVLLLTANRSGAVQCIRKEKRT